MLTVCFQAVLAAVDKLTVERGRRLILEAELEAHTSISTPGAVVPEQGGAEGRAGKKGGGFDLALALELVTQRPDSEDIDVLTAENLAYAENQAFCRASATDHTPLLLYCQNVA